MSYDRNGKRRCIVKKLNFEECVVGNFKGKNRKKSRLRATVSREYEKSEEDDFVAKIEKTSASGSPVLKSRSFAEEKLSTRSCRSETFDSVFRSPEKKSREPAARSPDFSSGLERNFKTASLASTPKRGKFPKGNESQGAKVTLSDSPVLSRRPRARSFFVPAKKKLMMPSSPNLTVKRKRDVFTRDSEESPSRIVFYRPDDIESATSQETLGGMEIDSSSSQSSFSISQTEKGISLPAEHKTPEKDGTDIEIPDSAKKRKRFKKNSLCARLEKLSKRPLSERTVFEHERKILKTERPGKISLSVLSFWRDSLWFLLKCRSLSEVESEENRFQENIILAVDGDLVKDVCRVKDNSVISVFPPWHRIDLPKLNSTVLLSIVCLEVTNQSILPTNSKITKSLIADDDFKLKDSFLIDCLFLL